MNYSFFWYYLAFCSLYWLNFIHLMNERLYVLGNKMTNYICYICIIIMLIEPYYLKHRIIVNLVVRSNKLKLRYMISMYIHICTLMHDVQRWKYKSRAPSLLLPCNKSLFNKSCWKSFYWKLNLQLVEQGETCNMKYNENLAENTRA